jgi:hypothetical protein
MVRTSRLPRDPPPWPSNSISQWIILEPMVHMDARLKTAASGRESEAEAEPEAAALPRCASCEEIRGVCDDGAGLARGRRPGSVSG